MPEVIKQYCPNYDLIVEFDYKKEDLITKHLIDYYRDYVYLVKEEEYSILQKLDNALNTYINKNNFYKKVQNHFNDLTDYQDDIVSNFIMLHEKHEDESLKDVLNTKWL